jgi:hypothetical protein
MSNEYLHLAFDDLVHIMSLSPAPPLATLDDSQLPLRPKTASPRPQNDTDIQEARMNITDIHDLGRGEKESSDVVRYVPFDIITGCQT